MLSRIVLLLSTTTHAFISRGIDFEANVAPTPGSPTTVLLEAALPIYPTSGNAFSWPIIVPDDRLCRRVSNLEVTLNGLRVPSAKGLSARLLHSGAAAFLFSSPGSATRIGNNPVHHAASTGSLSYEVSSSPPQHRFFDPMLSTNLARGKRAVSNSVLVGAVPERAVDGVRDGFLSNSGVFLSGPSPDGASLPDPWLEIDLGTSVTVGSVHVFDRERDTDGRGAGQGAVQEITVDTLMTVPTGTFTLSIVLNGQTYVTAPIALNAPAMIIDTVPAGPKSMQELLQALPPVGTVQVRRRLAGMSVWGAYSWRVTFVDRAGIPVLHAGSVSIPVGTGTVGVSTRVIRQGRGNTVFVNGGKPVSVFQPCPSSLFADGDEQCTDSACGSGIAPGYILLSSAPLGDVTLAQALVAPALLHVGRLPCPLPGSRRAIMSLRTTISARYVRLQRETGDGRPLAVAELEVYAQPVNSGAHWMGGTHLPAGSYHADDSLASTFAGGPAAGVWVLEMKFPVAAPSQRLQSKAEILAASVPPVMSTWQLHLTCNGARPDWDLNHDSDETGVRDDDPYPDAAYDSTSAPVQRSLEAGVSVTVHTWPAHGRIVRASRSRPAWEGPSPPASAWIGSTGGTIPAGTSIPAKEAPYEQCADGAQTRRNIDGSQTLCAKGGFVPKTPVPLSASDAASVPVGSATDRLLEVDWPNHGHAVTYDPHVGWGTKKSLASTLLPLVGEARIDGAATGSEGSDVIIYSALRTDQPDQRVLHRLTLIARRK